MPEHQPQDQCCPLCGGRELIDRYMSDETYLRGKTYIEIQCADCHCAAPRAAWNAPRPAAPAPDPRQAGLLPAILREQGL